MKLLLSILLSLYIVAVVVSGRDHKTPPTTYVIGNEYLDSSCTQTSIKYTVLKVNTCNLIGRNTTNQKYNDKGCNGDGKIQQYGIYTFGSSYHFTTRCSQYPVIPSKKVEFNQCIQIGNHYYNYTLTTNSTVFTQFNTQVQDYIYYQRVSTNDRQCNNFSSGAKVLVKENTIVLKDETIVKVNIQNVGYFNSSELIQHLPCSNCSCGSRDGAIYKDIQIYQLDEKRIKPDPSQVLVYGVGNGGFVNSLFEITIQSVNYYGELLYHGGDIFTVTVVGSYGELVPANVLDFGNGTYSISIVATNPSVYRVIIQLNGVTVKGSPFSIDIQGSDPSESTLYGPGLDMGYVNMENIFYIQGVDKDGQYITRGGDDFSVETDITNFIVPPTLKDNLNGTYTVTYIPNRGGDLAFSVLLRGTPVSGRNNIIVGVSNGYPANSYAFGEGINRSAELGVVNQIIIQAILFDGSNATSGGDDIKVSMTSPTGPAPQFTLTDNNNGVYVIKYQPSFIGFFILDIQLNQVSISDMPKRVQVEDFALSKSYAYGLGLWNATELKYQSFNVYAVYANGTNKTEGGDTVSVTLYSPPNTNQFLVTDNQDGSYNVTYIVNSIGTYQFKAFIGSGSRLFNIIGFPRYLRVYTLANATNSQLSIQSGQVYVGEYVNITLTCVDRRNDILDHGGAIVSANIDNVSNLEIIDNQDGTFAISFIPLDTSSRALIVNVEGNEMQPISINPILKP